MHYEVQSIVSLPYWSTKPSSFPSCVLVFNAGWNDFGIQTRFNLYYYDKDGRGHSIGELKLMKRNCEDTSEVIEKAFDRALGREFCSLGMGKHYYSSLYNLFKGGKEQWEILRDLRDCAYDDAIYESFANDSIYNSSLERGMEAGEARIQAKYLLKGGQDDSAVFSFSYVFSPEYLDGAYTQWDVMFLYNPPLFMRIVGLIGENGVGKTQLMRRLVKSLVTDGEELKPVPMFGSCITISSTPLDDYAGVVDQKTRIPLASFSIEQDTEKTFENISKCLVEIAERKQNIEMVLLPQLFQDFISELVGAEVDGLIEIMDLPKDIKVTINQSLLARLTKELSSGQLQILSLLACVCAHIHISSLLVIDEPEVHLHPQLIEQFMAALEKILKRFRSYAIIVTHSPLIVREIAGSNVFVMSKMQGGIPSIAQVGIETFGSEPTELYTSIFNYDERVSLIARFTRQAVKKGATYEKILSYLSQYMPEIGLGARVLIRDIVNENIN